MAKVSQASYGIATGYTSSSVPVTQPRDPTSSDVGYDVFQTWFNSSTSIFWILTSYTSASGTVLANWQQQSGSLNGLDVDTSSGAGTNPVVADVTGDITLTGAQVTSGTIGANVIRTNSLAASSATIQIQQAGEAAAENTTLNGVCHFDSTHFNLSNGFVTLSGGGPAIDSFIPDSGTSPVVPNASGQVTMSGSGSTTTVGGTNTLTTQLTGLTNHAVLVGAGTTTITKLSVGATGTLLVGATAADPAFATSAEGDFAFTQSSAASATNRKLVVSNADTSSSASNAQLIASVGGTSSGDAHIVWGVGSGRAYSLGPDTSDSSILKLTTAAAATVTPSTGTSLWRMTSSGSRTMGQQPLFEAISSATQANATGGAAGPDVTVIFGTIVEQRGGSNYNNATGAFTVPVAGFYLFNWGLQLTGLDATHTQGASDIYVNGVRRTAFFSGSYASMRNITGLLEINGSGIMQLNVSDLITVHTQVVGAAQTVNIVSGVNTSFSGCLLF